MLQAYKGEIPFHTWLQQYFRENKQFGSKDRRFYRDACYAYWRLGFPQIQPENILLHICAGLWQQNLYAEEITQWFILQDIEPKKILQQIQPAYSRFEHLLDPPFIASSLQPWFLLFPPVFLIANPGKEKLLENTIAESNLQPIKTQYGFQFPQSTQLDDYIENGLGRIMDIGSQLCVENLPIKNDDIVWDCCCGAGGKSLMLKQLYPSITLYASDSRQSIVYNLEKRFHLAQIPTPFAGINDMSRPQKQLQFQTDIVFQKPVFDMVIADVPCSGSGTWRRNPEELCFFNETKLNTYSQLQLNIAKNAIQFLKPGGVFVYLTCSVFSAENSANVQNLLLEEKLELISSEYVGGVKVNGDILFRAIFIKK